MAPKTLKTEPDPDLRKALTVIASREFPAFVREMARRCPFPDGIYDNPTTQAASDGRRAGYLKFMDVLRDIASERGVNPDGLNEIDSMQPTQPTEFN